MPESGAMSSFQPLPVEPTFTEWNGHRIANYCAGAGDPVLLVHSINAAASAFEMRGPFNGLQDAFHVCAIDLLGFGRSDRPARRYSAEDYIDQVGQTLQRIGKPTVIIGSTLGAAYCIAVAARMPHLVRALVLVCPTGISLLDKPPGPSAAFRYSLLRGPVGEAVFAGLVTRPSMTFFVKHQTYGDPARVSEETFAGFYDAAHQPGASHAPICFVSGLLNCNVKAPFAALTMPILIVWGRKAAITTVDQADDFVKLNPRARLKVFDDCGMIVQDERSDEFNALVKQFLTEQEQKA
jgi:pimeloyl-ACP methyl ester carboxylesterase